MDERTYGQQLNIFGPAEEAPQAPTGQLLTQAAPPPTSQPWYTLPRSGQPLTTAGMFGSPLAGALSGAALASPVGRDILGAHFQQQNFETQAGQHQQQLDLQKKRDDRQGLLQGVDLLKTIADMPVGSAQRKYASKKFGSLWQGITGQEADPDFLSMLSSSDEEDSQALKEGFEKLVAQFPELGIGGLSQIITKHPDLVIKLMGEAVKARKDQAKAETDRAEVDALKALGGSPGPSATPLAPQTRPTPLTPPRASQGPPTALPATLATSEGQATQQFVIHRAESLGIPPDIAQGLMHVESGWNPSAVSPTGVTGVAQVTNATGAPYGLTPEKRTNPIASADVGLRHLSDLIKQNGGNIDAALKQYGDPKDLTYVQKVREAAQLYRPHSQAVREAPSDYQGSVSQLDGELKVLGDKLAAIRFAPGDKANKIRDDLRQEMAAKQKLLDSLEKRYENQVTPEFRQWMSFNTPYRNPADIPQPLLEVYGKKFKAEEDARKLNVSKNQGAEAERLKPLSPTEQKTLYVVDPTTGDQERVNPLWTQGDKMDAKAAGQKVVQLDPLSDTQQKELATRANTITNLQTLATDHAAFTTGPLAGRFERWGLKLGATVNSNATAQRQILAKIENDLAFERGGRTLTPTELDRIKKELPQDTDPPETFQTSLKGAVSLLTQYHKRHNKGLRESGTFVPPAYDNPETPISGEARDPAVQEMLDDLKSGKKR